MAGRNRPRNANKRALARQAAPAQQGRPKQQQQPQVSGQLLQVLEQFSGPIPPPALLREYDGIIQNGAERIFSSFERQSSHRQELERAVVLGNERRASRGQWMAYSLALIIIALGVALIVNGYQAGGIALITVDLVGLVAVFVYGKRSESEERRQKYGM